MKRLRALFGAVLAVVLAFSTPATAITDYGDPAITRLWADTGSQFVCSASYIFPRINDNVAWIITAGHCSLADSVRRNADDNVIGMVDWRGMVLWQSNYTTTCADLAIGTVPDTRTDHKRLFLAQQMPKNGVAYVHGFPIGVENVTYAQILTSRQADAVLGDGAAAYFEGCRLMLTPKNVIKGGSSGSAVMDGQGYVIGVLWGLIDDASPDYDVVIVTPVERLHKLMDSIGVRSTYSDTTGT